MEILALIGLAAILLLIAKGLRKAGRALERIGDALILQDGSVGKVRARARRDAAETEAKVLAVKGDAHVADNEFMDNARKEIDELTDTDD